MSLQSSELPVGVGRRVRLVIAYSEPAVKGQLAA